MVDINEYLVEKDCWYKEEHYSVRDNGAIFRHKREGKAKRPNDCVWTFGKTGHNQYLYFGNIPVHRIVATAFKGESPTDQHVVDHIDTNRQNNRPENLRWLTKLENILNNEITRAKVESICGSIEAFLENPSLLFNHEFKDRNFTWMKTVTKEQAANSLKNIQQWLKQPKPSERTGNHIGDWIFHDKIGIHNEHSSTNGMMIKKQTIQDSDLPSFQPQTKTSELTWDMIRECLNKPYSENKPETSNQQENDANAIVPEYFDSLTPCAIQHKDWKTPTKFPQCPSEYIGLEGYCNKLRKGVVFSQNHNVKTYVEDAAISLDGKQIVVKAKMPEGSLKYGSVDLVFEYNGKYAHKNYRTFFEEIGAEKYFILMQGKEWTRGEVLDDGC